MAMDGSEIQSGAPALPDRGGGQGEEPSGGSKGIGHFFDRMIHGGRPSPEDRAETSGEGSPPDQSEPRTSPPPPAWTPPQTPQELDRLVQSRTDAELYRREAAKREREVTELLDRAERAFDEGDDILGGDLKRQAKAIEQGETTDAAQRVGEISDFYDHVFLDSYLAKLDTPTRDALLAEPIVGGNGRALLAGRIADALYQKGVHEGEQKAEKRLRSNPAFRKELVHQIRPELGEPEHLPAVGATSGGSSMDDFIRTAMKR